MAALVQSLCKPERWLAKRGDTLVTTATSASCRWLVVHVIYNQVKLAMSWLLLQLIAQKLDGSLPSQLSGFRIIGFRLVFLKKTNALYPGSYIN